MENILIYDKKDLNDYNKDDLIILLAQGVYNRMDDEEKLKLKEVSWDKYEENIVASICSYLYCINKSRVSLRDAIRDLF